MADLSIRPASQCRFDAVSLGEVVREGDRSNRAAPIRSLASASTSACTMKPSLIRIISPPSAAFSASPSSSRADWFRVIALSPVL